MDDDTNDYDEFFTERDKVIERFEQNKNLLTLKALLCNPLPYIDFKQHTTVTNHVSGHESVDKITTGTLSILTGLVTSISANQSILALRSSFLDCIINKRQYVLKYTSESNISDVIGLLLDDIVTVGAWTDVLNVHEETFVPHAKYLGRGTGNKSDFWLIYRDRRPIFLVVVKSPHMPNILDNELVLGQITDYMLDIASFYGQKNGYGMTTNGKEFRFHWLPQASDDAASPFVKNRRNEILDEPQPLLERKVCCTDVLSHDNPSIIPLLLSVIVKSMASPRYAVPLLSATRVYITLSKDAWQWQVMDPAVVRYGKLKLEVDQSSAQSSKFVVLRPFARQAGQLVWLACTSDTQQVVVLKQFSDLTDAVRECDIWNTVNDHKYSRVLTVRGSPTLLMPLVLMVRETDGDVVLDYDVLNYLFITPPTPAALSGLPPYLHALRDSINNCVVQSGYADHLDVLVETAIDAMAHQGVVQRDLEWRHFGVLPVFENGEVSGVRPVMIDFGEIERVCESVNAKRVMMAMMTKKLDMLK